MISISQLELSEFEAKQREWCDILPPSSSRANNWMPPVVGFYFNCQFFRYAIYVLLLDIVIVLYIFTIVSRKEGLWQCGLVTKEFLEPTCDTDASVYSGEVYYNQLIKLTISLSRMQMLPMYPYKCAAATNWWLWIWRIQGKTYRTWRQCQRHWDGKWHVVSVVYFLYPFYTSILFAFHTSRLLASIYISPVCKMRQCSARERRRQSGFLSGVERHNQNYIHLYNFYISVNLFVYLSVVEHQK